jgi:hypothetical protein
MFHISTKTAATLIPLGTMAVVVNFHPPDTFTSYKSLLQFRNCPAVNKFIKDIDQ